MTTDPSDLGFTFRERRSGEVQIFRDGRPVTMLRGLKAQTFLAEVAAGDAALAQQLMARLTGNYRRGNERAASRHPRNR
jgi:hypothetical protein